MKKIFVILLMVVVAVFVFAKTSKVGMLSKQLSILSPIKVLFPENFTPNYVESTNIENRFVVYGYQVSTGGNWNSYNKALFLIDGDGQIITKTAISSSCQFPYTIQDLGLVMDYCKPQSSSVYKVFSDRIELKEDGLSMYDNSSAIRVNSIKIKNNGSDNYLNSEIIYRRTCVDSWGSCAPKNESITKSGSTAFLKGYSLRDEAKIDDKAVALIFGTGGPTSSNDNNELFIISSSK